MIPLGVLGSARAGSSLTFGYRAAAASLADSSTYTFPAVELGPAGSGRAVIVAVSGRKAGVAATISSITIGGVSATIDKVAGDGGGTGVEVARATVPTGTSGDVVVTWSTTVLRCHVAVWSGPPCSPVASDSRTFGSNGWNSLSSTLTLSGFAVGDIAVSAAAYVSPAGSGVTWTGAVGVYGSPIGENFVTAGAVGSSGTVTATTTGTAELGAHIAIAYRP